MPFPLSRPCLLLPPSNTNVQACNYVRRYDGTSQSITLPHFTPPCPRPLPPATSLPSSTPFPHRSILPPPLSFCLISQQGKRIGKRNEALMAKGTGLRSIVAVTSTGTAIKLIKRPYALVWLETTGRTSTKPPQ